jgi:tetratricopeptide (TPR) repeat protein
MSKRVKVIIGIIGVIVIAGAGVTFAFWPAISGFVGGILGIGRADTDADPQGTQPLSVVVDPKIVAKAETAESKGDVPGAIAVYDEALAQTEDKAMKSEVYLKKALVYSNADDLQASITEAEQAHANNQSSLAPVTLLALLYEDVGNFSKAADYYRKAADLIDADSLIPTDKEYYLENAVRLEAM